MPSLSDSKPYWLGFLLLLVSFTAPISAQDAVYHMQVAALECLNVVQDTIGPEWVVALDADTPGQSQVKSSEGDLILTYNARLFPGDIPVSIVCNYTKYAERFVSGGIVAR